MKGTKWMILLCAAMLSCGMTVSAAPFDPAYYAAQNPDVVQALGEDEAALKLHYNIFGAAEGRAANAQEAAARKAAQKTGSIMGFEEFDPAYYAEQNPDVAALLGTDPAALYAHYVMLGAAEGRLPKAPEVVDPYARFASSASSSKSSKHSKHSDGEGDDSSSAGSGSSSGSGSGISGTEPHEPVWGSWTQWSGNGDFHERKCTVPGCTVDGHSEKKACQNTYTVVDDKTHQKECITCGRSGTYAHEPSCRTVGNDKHEKTCTSCSWALPAESCVYDRYTYNSDSRCRAHCEGGHSRDIEHDVGDDGKCKNCGHEFNS